VIELAVKKFNHFNVRLITMLIRAGISSTASEMPPARAHNPEQAKQNSNYNPKKVVVCCFRNISI
jgi:hypothetical protein